jgi:hypothetical protein
VLARVGECELATQRGAHGRDGDAVDGIDDVGAAQGGEGAGGDLGAFGAPLRGEVGQPVVVPTAPDLGGEQRIERAQPVQVRLGDRVDGGGPAGSGPARVGGVHRSSVAKVSQRSGSPDW